VSAYDGDWVTSLVLMDRAERFPDKPFIVSEAGDLTYPAVVDLAGRVATALRELGIEPGDRVATMLPPTNDYIAAWFGIVWAGAVDAGRWSCWSAGSIASPVWSYRSSST
jgi:acyl-CoA synthetase (AMP-forming)/AMP-acid ligase II